MNKFITKQLLALVLCLFTSLSLANYTVSAVENTKTAVTTETELLNYTDVDPLNLVKNPDSYINKNVKFDATFVKFSTLGLDYEPAMRSSKDYISFLIKRPNIEDYTIPLSELKIFIKREQAEKLIDLEKGNKIRVYGHIFSSALSDAWLEAEKVENLTPKSKTKEK